jgi:hypothetical protein
VQQTCTVTESDLLARQFTLIGWKETWKSEHHAPMVTITPRHKLASAGQMATGIFIILLGICLLLLSSHFAADGSSTRDRQHDCSPRQGCAACERKRERPSQTNVQPRT